MKSLYLIAALCGIWMSVDGALLECLLKIKEEQNLSDDLANVVFNTSGYISDKIIDNIEHENFQESLNKAISNFCYSAEVEEILYPMVMRILKICGTGDDLFTDRGKQMAKSILKHSFCDGFVKPLVIEEFTSRDKCFNDLSTIIGLEKCLEGSNKAFKKWLSSDNTGMCTYQAETAVCINQIVKKNCSNSTSNFIESVSFDVLNMFGCASEPNVTVSFNQNEISSLLEISTLDSNLWGSTSMSELKGKCMSKIQNEQHIVRDMTNLKQTLRNGFDNITKNLSKRNSVESLDSIANDVCLNTINVDNLYSSMMRVFNICISQEDIFTEDGKQMFESFVKRSSCNVPMKIASLGSYWTRDDCDISLTELTLYCVRATAPLSDPSPRYEFSKNNSMCRDISAVVSCASGGSKILCPASLGKTESLLVETMNFISECDFSINPLAVIEPREFLEGMFKTNLSK